MAGAVPRHACLSIARKQEQRHDSDSQHPSGRSAEDMRPVALEPDVAKYAEGSCCVKFGDTQVLCTASVDDRVPPFLRNSGSGWVTAEYGMLPRSTHTRTDREAARGKQSGRTQEIQRLIGRSLRAVTDLKGLGERQIKIDCDVLQADGGTMLYNCRIFQSPCIWPTKLVTLGALKQIPLTDHVAAVSCGIYQSVPVLDLDYAEDSSAEADANFVPDRHSWHVGGKATAEEKPFAERAIHRDAAACPKGISTLVDLRREPRSGGELFYGPYLLQEKTDDRQP